MKSESRSISSLATAEVGVVRQRSRTGAAKLSAFANELVGSVVSEEPAVEIAEPVGTAEPVGIAELEGIAELVGIAEPVGTEPVGIA